ncbi:hypothetical protein D3C77_299460 [compost metagenome]
MHRVIYLLVNRCIYAVASCKKLLTRFFKQLRAAEQFFLAHLRVIHHSDDESALSLSFKHEIRISLVSLLCLLCQRAFDVEG